MSRTCVLLVLCAMLHPLGGCAKVVYYRGDAYQSTDHVDVFESVVDIGREHYIFGEMEVKSTFKAGLGTLKGRAVEEAKKRGADAIVIVATEKEALRTSGFFHPSSIEVRAVQVFFVKYGAKP